MPVPGRRSVRRRAISPGSVLKQIALWLICSVALIPLYFLIVTSLKSKTEYLLNMWGLPLRPTLENFSTAMADGRLIAWTWNSTVVTFLSVAVCTVVSALAAYAFAQMQFRGRDVLLNIFIAMIVIPPVIMIIPLFILMVNINLVNTYWSAIVIYAGLMIRIFTALILPLSLPALVTLVIVNALFVWNELLIALTFLQDDSVRTLMAGLTEFKGRFFLNQPLIMTGALIATVPMIIVYVAGQRYFVRGLVAGAVK